MKIKKSKLAILGGAKVITKKPPHFIWPPIDKKIERAVINQLHKTISIYDKGGVSETLKNLSLNTIKGNLLSSAVQEPLLSIQCFLLLILKKEMK